MSCINYNIYHPLLTDSNGRIALTTPVPQTICLPDTSVPYPPPEYLCGPGENIKYYFANLITGYGMVVCGPSRPRR